MSSYNVASYKNEFLEIWDSFIQNSRNGTFLNSKRFLNYHPPERFLDSSLMFYKKNNLIAVFPAAQIRDENKMILFSHPGATYGGIIIGTKVRLKDIDEIVDQLKQFAINNDYNKIVIKVPPRIYHKYPSDEIEFILFKNDFKVIKRDLTTAIYLPNFGKKFGVSMDSRCKRAIRSAENQGLVVKESNNLEAYWQILIENLKKYNTSPIHTITEIKLLKSLFPNKIKLFSAFIEDQMVAGTLIFITQTTIHTQYIAMLYEYQHYRPTNAVFNYLIQKGISENFLYLNFGVSTEGFGEKINWNLFDFKESFGARGIIHELYELEFKRGNEI